MRSIEQRLDARARTRAWRGEQCHVVATGHESLGQQIDDRLDPTVTGRRHRNPRRRKHRDPQRFDADANRGEQPKGRARGAHRELRIGNRLALHLEPVRSVGVTSDRSACGAEPSRYSSAGESGEENSLTWIDAHAMHRGQCSILDPRAFGLMLRPQRGQFRNGTARGLAAFSLPLFNGPRSIISPASPGKGEPQSSEACRRALGWTASMIVCAPRTSDAATPDASAACRRDDVLVAGGSVDTAHLWLAWVAENGQPIRWS
jgi:hypothetical protein